MTRERWLSKMVRVVKRRLLCPDRFLSRCRGVIHVGANDGWERYQYEKLGLNVLWVEALPEACERLRTNIKGFKKQKMICAVLSESANQVVRFNVASNSGKSSSMFDFAEHRKVHPNVSWSQSIELKTQTLDGLRQDGVFDPRDYDALVLDTQGSEALVLAGAVRSLASMVYVKTEAADFELYQSGCRLEQLIKFLSVHGFQELRRSTIGVYPGLGSEYEVVFSRSTAS